MGTSETHLQTYRLVKHTSDQESLPPPAAQGLWRMCTSRKNASASGRAHAAECSRNSRIQIQPNQPPQLRSPQSHTVATKARPRRTRRVEPSHRYYTILLYYDTILQYNSPRPSHEALRAERRRRHRARTSRVRSHHRSRAVDRLRRGRAGGGGGRWEVGAEVGVEVGAEVCQRRCGWRCGGSSQRQGANRNEIHRRSGSFASRVEDAHRLVDAHIRRGFVCVSHIY